MLVVQAERSEVFDGSLTCWHIAIGHITVINQSFGIHCSAAPLIKACSTCQSMSKTAMAAVSSWRAMSSIVAFA